jgi:hypothetical protein
MIFNNKITKLIAAFVFLLALSGCATMTVTSISSQTPELAKFAQEAFETAAMVGEEHVLVVFDLDNTLLAMEQDLGSDQWYEWQKELSSHAPCDERLVSDRLAIQGAMFYGSAMRPTQSDSAAILRSIQDAGIPVIALTSRGTEFRLQTFRELRRNGYDFRRNAIGPEGGWNEDFIPEHGVRPARYEDGVFLTTGQHKGAMLKDLIDKTNTTMPRAILMLDDKDSNLNAVIETFSELNVPVRAWRYTGEEDQVARFDGDNSHEQLEALLPAFQAIQEVLGPDNFELPANNRVTNCEENANND